MRSPYYSRVADPDAGLSSEESKVTKYFVTDESRIPLSKSSQQSDRLQIESVGQEYIETNILDAWAVVRNHMEEYRSNDSPFRLFLPTFVVDKDSFSQIRNHDGRFEIGAQHVESVIRATSELNKLKKIDLVFLPVDNEGHRFLLTFDLKYGAVTMFDQKKKDKIIKKSKIRKGAKIANSIVAEMLHADFGRYLYGLDHIKARNIIIAELEIGEYEWQTATLRPYAGLILMRIMETYMGKGMRNWDMRLDSNGVKLQKKLTVLCKKYAATILMSDCNVLKEQVKAISA
ncbi:alternative oxidase 1 [Tanacetum coccineum]|uniref:Alternative oxidase 1 n=1 Tax=Tanacetum coccineum TaxID=301880 RepID=A0ABQ5FSU9_9ASTR